jgi:small-conductance mechanosensitive channel
MHAIDIINTRRAISRNRLRIKGTIAKCLTNLALTIFPPGRNPEKLMRVAVYKILERLLLLTVVLISSRGMAYAQSQIEQNNDTEKKITITVPDLSEVVPLAAQLSSRLSVMERRIKEIPEFFAIESNLQGIETNLRDAAGQLQRLVDLKEYKYYKLVELKETIKQESRRFDEISKPLESTIRELGVWRKEWQTQKKQWNEWQIYLLEEEELDELDLTFEKANNTIEQALALVISRLEAMLKMQETAGSIQTQLSIFTIELDGLIADKRHSALLSESPPMFSTRFYSQFSDDLWHASQRGLDDTFWHNRRFLDRQGWIVFIQVLLSLFLTIATFRNRKALNDSARWRFLAARPVASGLFLVFIVTLYIYEYQGAPALWKFTNMAVAGICFARLSGALIDTSWQRQFVYGLIAVLIGIRLLDVLNFPLPLFRVYTVVTSLVGLIFCVRWAAQCIRSGEPVIYVWLLRLGALIFVFILAADLWGKDPLPLYLLTSLVDTIATTLVFLLLMYLIHGGLEWLFRSSPLSRAAVLQSGTDEIVNRVGRFIDAVIWGLIVVPAFLVIWGVYDGQQEATKGLLALGFHLGPQRVTVGLLIVTAGIIYATFIASRIIQKLLADVILLKRKAEKGVRYSIARLVHYVIICLGFLLAISALGFEITKLTIMLSALGVGIGFGLQGIANNFVSGLILLFEGPVRVGDSIEIGGTWAEIKKIGLRATTVETVEQADLIIPNADLINNQVINWTLSNRRVRLSVPVGVAYGSNVSLVIETLMACASANSMVVKLPAPQVLFLSFGDSTLNFELRVWVLDADYRLKAKSELNQEIDRRFREAGIEIAFPQRDLHIKTAVPLPISR